MSRQARETSAQLVTGTLNNDKYSSPELDFRSWKKIVLFLYRQQVSAMFSYQNRTAMPVANKRTGSKTNFQWDRAKPIAFWNDPLEQSQETIDVSFSTLCRGEKTTAMTGAMLVWKAGHSSATDSDSSRQWIRRQPWGSRLCALCGSGEYGTYEDPISPGQRNLWEIPSDHPEWVLFLVIRRKLYHSLDGCWWM
jgi:hypothetical protein